MRHSRLVSISLFGLVVSALTVGCGTKSKGTHGGGISGTITGAPAGVTVTLGGKAISSTTTDASGNYQFTGLSSGDYTVTPSLSGYVFTPASYPDVEVDGASVTGQDFTAVAVPSTHAISGTVSGAVSAGVTVTLGGDATSSTTTDLGGHYQFSLLPDGTYTVTPRLSGYAFTPASYPAVTVNGADVTGEDFISGALQVTGVTAGNTHTCAIANGGVQCWGDDSYGQLGINSTQGSAVPVSVPGLNGVSAIGAGQVHTCAALSGALECWGRNANGQLGDNSTTDRPAPVQVSGLTSGVSAVAGGGWHTCAIVNGGAQCWGYNGQGQLGDNTDTDRYTPVQVTGLTNGVTAIATGGAFSCAIVSGGAWCWGYNAEGQLGNNSTSDFSYVPVQVYGLASGVTAIAAGNDFACAAVNGAVKCWGANDYGSLGNNSTSGSNVPVQVDGLTSGATALAASDQGGHVCAIVDGGATCWGENYFAQLGDGSSSADSLVPVQVSGLTSGATAITAGVGHTCAVVGNGVQCWGYNAYGEVGDGSYVQRDVPVEVSGL